MVGNVGLCAEINAVSSVVHRDHFHCGVRHDYFFSAKVALRLHDHRHGHAAAASRSGLGKHGQHIAREYWRLEFNAVKKNRDPAMKSMFARFQVRRFVDQA